MSRLRCDHSDEPLPKRLKLAENVLYSPDIPIAWKEDCIFRWLCSELSQENNSAIWITIHRCLSVNPKTFTRLSLESRNLLIEKIIQSLNDYPEKKISEETVKCCTYIFSIANTQSYLKRNNELFLMKALIIFTLKVLNLDNLEHSYLFVNETLAIESVKYAISTIVEICKQNFSEKNNFALIFIDEILFPLASLAAAIKAKKMPSKLILENQKCIKKLIFNCLKNVTLPSNEKNRISEETETLLETIKIKASTANFEEVKAVFISLFESVVNNFRQNSTIVDIILRKLCKCIEQKEQSKKILAILLEHSLDISYNFDNEIDGCTLKLFLQTQITQIKSKKKPLKYFDYELLTAITKLNPLIIENEIQNLLERMFFENTKSEKEIIAYENLVTELWKSTVRLRRQHKFLSKFLLALISCKDREIDTEFINAFKLSTNFIIEFRKDLKSRTTSAQILAMLNTLLFHLKTDCVNKLQIPELICKFIIFININVIIIINNILNLIHLFQHILVYQLKLLHNLLLLSLNTLTF
jgi:hypothetical protein